MRYAILILFLAGCTAAPPDPKPPIPKFASNAKPLALSAPMAPHKPREFYMSLSYPPDSSNYLWQLQQSTNKTNWVTIAPGPGTYTWDNQWWWFGGPSNWNYNVTVTNNQTIFWRLRGVKP